MSARKHAILAFCPPDNSEGNLFIISIKPTFSNRSFINLYS